MQEFEESEKEILVFSKKLKKMRFETRRLTHDLDEYGVDISIRFSTTLENFVCIVHSIRATTMREIYSIIGCPWPRARMKPPLCNLHSEKPVLTHFSLSSPSLLSFTRHRL